MFVQKWISTYPQTVWVQKEQGCYSDGDPIKGEADNRSESGLHDDEAWTRSKRSCVKIAATWTFLYKTDSSGSRPHTGISVTIMQQYSSVLGLKPQPLSSQFEFNTAVAIDAAVANGYFVTST